MDQETHAYPDSKALPNSINPIRKSQLNLLSFVRTYRRRKRSIKNVYYLDGIKAM